MLPAAVSWGEGKDDLVFRLSERPTYWLTRPPNIELPMVSLYGSGRMIWHAEGQGIVSGAPPPTAMQAQLTPAGMRSMLEMVHGTGLLDDGSVDLQYPCRNMSVTDSNVVYLLVVTSEGEVLVSTYALGFHRDPACVPSEQHASYLAMEALVAAVAELPAGLEADKIGPITPYVPPTLNIDVLRRDARPGAPVLEWPLGHLPREEAKGRSTGGDAERIRR